MQHSVVEKKKEVFLDQLRQKYPHHAAIIMGHQERMREQVRFKFCLYYRLYIKMDIVRCEVCHHLLVCIEASLGVESCSLWSASSFPFGATTFQIKSAGHELELEE